ncbi:MAG: tetratricopeptide repeat protein [Candidatus Binataceae bacterium]
MPRVKARPKTAKPRRDMAQCESTSAELSTPPALLYSFLLWAGTFGLYLTAFHNAFINYDDPQYVTANAHVLRGLSWDNVSWALTATTEANWHPLTWISHMADVQFFALNAGDHHLVSVALHATNAVLVFLALYKATGYAQRSALVAALFAVEPFNVECVAWVAERKSLLSMLFMLLALLAYGWYVRNRTLGRYLSMALLFALGLAAKPMVVTFPFLLLLWDYWPLRGGTVESEIAASHPTLRELVLEKVPLLTMSAGSAWITVYAQHKGGALSVAELLPLRLRIGNALYSYVAYIFKGVWPSRLAVFYPYPTNQLVLWKILLAAALMAAITTLAWFYRERRYALTGWLWYVGAMVPMIGIVQVGSQGMADRYAYLPFVGLYIIAVWGISELLARYKTPRMATIGAVFAVLAGYASVSYHQIHYWRDSYTLFSHAIQVTSRNGVAENSLGYSLTEMRKRDLALPHFEAAVEFEPRLAGAHYNLAVLLEQQNDLDRAKREYELTLEYSADRREQAQAHSNLGFILMRLNQPLEATQEFDAALQINPDRQNSLLGRGMIEYRQGNMSAALADFTRASRIAPMALAEFWVGRTLEDTGQLQAASSAYQAALHLAPGMKEAQQRLAALGASLHQNTTQGSGPQP